jgi:hypothetical protein
MTDIHVHKQMRKCCREALKKLDDVRAAARRAAGATRQGRAAPGDGSTLVSVLGSLPIPGATIVVNQLQATHSELMLVEVSGKSVWDSTISAHRSVHTKAQETREAAFWNAIAVPVEVIDLSGSSGLNQMIFDRFNGKKKFSIGEEGDKPGQGLLNHFKEKAGDRFDLVDGALVFKVSSPTDGASVYLGVGKIKEPGGATGKGAVWEVKVKW